ncbi:hypothetical protein HRbin20_01435 [bacterium HR20]|nr:hypothetical protein HRbin20_01435 [bacterium HR20]
MEYYVEYLHAVTGECIENAFCKVKPSSRRCYRAFGLRVDGLVALEVFGGWLAADIGRQWNVS